MGNAAQEAIEWRRQDRRVNLRQRFPGANHIADLRVRADVIGNAGVLLAAGAVAVTASPWPDIVIGLVVAGMFGRSAVQVIRDASRELALSN